MVKEYLRKVINGVGIQAFRHKRLPYGIDWVWDTLRTGHPINPKVIFDVGANIGQTSAFFRDTFTNSDIYAFEPVSSTYHQLVKNVSNKKVKTFKIAFGERKKTERIFPQPGSGLNSLIKSLNQPESNDQASEEVEVSTVDDFCRENHITQISLLKIDTEGFGRRVLHGAKNMLRDKNIETVFIEVGFSENDERHDHFGEVHSILASYSFRLVGFYNQWIENSTLEYCNAFFALKS